jgi:UDPglucose 6-dehydrogenase
VAQYEFPFLGFMTVCVFGLWHLGCVTAACVAERYRVTGLDPDPEVVAGLQAARPPVFEPGLGELIQSGISQGMLRFTTDALEAISAARIVWITFDTPVNESDEADFEWVEARIASLFPHLRDDSIVLISSQLPAGATSRLAARYRLEHPRGRASFAYSPENLRLGKALEVFRNPGRIVVGVRTQEDRQRLADFLAPFCQNLAWMSVESAEMTKHALNAFLASSVAFMNEVAVLCEQAGADAKQVEHGLKSDERIGPRSYLSPGAAFAGGTLARDVSFLVDKSRRAGIPSPVLAAIRESNEFHKTWPRRKLEALLGPLAGRKVSLLGLTYKPGTNTLRRSAAVELCRWLASKQAAVCAFDPSIEHLPADLNLEITLCRSALEAAADSDAVVIATEWPVFRELRALDLIARMKNPMVVDAGRFLETSLGIAPPLRYIAVGKPAEAA